MMTTANRVLYVDDEPDLLEIGKLFLEESGDFIVMTALSADEALQLLEQETFNAIVSDYQMPGMDGIQFLVEVRKRFGPIPFILFTGRGREEVVIQAINSGADFYLQKGGEPGAQFAELAHKVKAAVTRKIADDALRKSEEKYRHLIEHSEELIVVAQNGMLKLVNHKTVELTGYSEQELLSMSFSACIHPDDQTLVMERYHKRINGEEAPSRYAFRLSSKEGIIRWVELSVVVIDWEGSPATLNFLTDITERKLAEAELLESNERYKSLITVSNTGAWEYNRDCNYLWFSPEYFLILGRDAKEFDSSGAANLKETWIDLLHPNDRDRAIEHFTQYLDRGSPGIYENHFRMQHAAGHWVWIWSRGWTLRDKNGSLTNKTIGTHIDVTESRQTEEARRINNEHLRLAQEIGQTGSWELDFATGMIWGSEEAFKIFAVPRPEDGILSLEAVEARIPERERVHRALTDLIETGAEYNIEYTIYTDDNSSRKIVHSVARILTDAKNKPVRIVGVTQDVTGLRKAEASLLRHSEMLSILNDLITTANRADDLAQLLDTILTELLNLLDFDAGGIYLVDRTTRTAKIVQSKYLPQEFLAEIQTVSIDTKPYDMLFIQNESFITDNYAQINPPQSKKYGFLSIASIPLLSKGMTIGALNIASKKRRVISEEEKQTLLSISSELGSTIERMIAEEEAKNASKNLETLFNSIDEMVFVLDMQGRILVVNNTVLKRLLYTSEELTGMDVLQLHVPELRDDALRNVQGVIAGTIDSCPVPVLAKDGTRIDVETKVTRGLWNGKEVLIGVSREITERKRAEDALRESEERYKHISETTSDFVFSCIKHEGGTYSIDWIAGAVEKITGYTIDELRAMVCWRCLVHPDDRSVFDENITNLPEGTSRSCILRIRTKNGTERWLAVTTTHIPGKDSSSCCHVFGGCRDITERKLAEETLKESEEFNRTLIENLPDYIIVYRPDGKILYVNPATEKEFGYNLNELVGTSVMSYVAPECRTRVTAAMANRLKGDDTPEYETVLITKDGQQKTVIAKGTLVHYHDGLATLLLLTDITERKVAERVLLESEEKYRVIFNNDIYAICIFDLDTLNLLDVNDAYTKMYGYTRNELLSGMTVHDITAEHEASDSATGEAINRGTIFIPLRYHKKKDHTIFPVEIVGGPYLWNGKKVMFALTHDITERKNAEETLRKSEEKYRQLIELAQEGIWAIDADGNTTYVNQQMAKILGYNAEEMLGVHLFSFMDDTGKIIAAANMERRRQGIKEKHDFEFITKGGNRIYAHLSTSPILDENGVYLGALAVVTDITERKNADEALKNEKQRLANIIEGTRAGTWEWNVQTGETIFNEQWAEIIGYTLSELSPVSIKTWMNYAHPDDLQKSGELLEQHFLQKSEWYECESRMKDKNGNWIWVLDRGKVASWTKDGKPLWMYGTHLDITERKVAEGALRESEQKLSSILNDINDVVWSLSWPDMDVFYISPSVEKVYGRSLQEFKEKPSLWAEVTHPDDKQISDNALEQLRKVGSAQRECRIVRPDGSIVWVHEKSKIIFDQNDTPVRVDGITSDISERKELEKEMEYHALELRKFSSSLATANKKLTLLSSITRHDINNQLTVLMGFLTILKKKQPDPLLSDYFVKVSNAAQRISSMIQFTKEYENIGVNTPIWQDCRTLIDTAAKQAPLGQVTVKNDLPAIAEVFADPLFVKVFYNLMDNAARHGGKITTIQFSVDERDGNHLIVCEDDGDGIVAEEKEKIFERGFGKNTGLGLALSREILDITGIAIKETGESGKGARFEMMVPKGAWRMIGNGT